MSKCTNLGKKTTTFAEVTQQSVEHNTTQEHMPRNTCKITGQQRVMFNKIVNTNRTITKFATFVPYTCMIMCTDFGKKRTSFTEVTLKNLMDQSLWTRACGSPEGGRGSMDHYQICYRCSICLNE